MTIKRQVILSIICLIFFSCGELLLEPDPENTPEKNFDLLWEDFDKTYSFFLHKRINWDSLYAVYRPQITPQTTGKQLFEITSAMLTPLEDGHVNLQTPYGNYAYTGWYDRFPENFTGLDNIKSRYLTNFGTNNVISYGLLTDYILYIYINSFGRGERIYDIIDQIIEEFKELGSIVVDVRDNTGGSDTNGKTIASRFADQKRLYRYVRFRNGPDHADFTDFIPDHIEPSGERRFTKPVALLTNRKCFSATEGFIQSMQTFPQVIVVGDTTGGGSGNPVLRELPNGWTYRLPRWIQYTADKKIFEGIGLAPDIPVWITDSDLQLGKDTILETAIQTLIH